MRAATQAVFGALALMATATCTAAEWKQVFRQTTPAAPAPAASAPAAPAASPARRARTVSAGTSRSATAPAVVTPARAVVAAPTLDISHGEELYRRGDFAGAARAFEANALTTGTPAQQSSMLFRLGVQWQSEVLSAPAAQKLAARDAAVSAYQKTLEFNPNSGAALNNLAQIYKSDAAKVGEADQLLARAISLDDPRKGVYLMNRATLQRDAGDFKAATRFAQQAAADDKGNLEAHQLVMNILAKSGDASGLLAYIRDLNSRGLVVRALDSAAEGLTTFPDARKKLLTSVAASIGDPAYTANPWLFAKTDAGQIIAGFANDPVIGAGVNELLGTLKSPVPAETLAWWRNGYDGFTPPAPGSPAEAIQNLTRRCGEIYQVAGDKRAEGYYRMSVALSGRMSTDPRALLGLTEVLYEQKRVDDLNQVLADNEQGLMEAKGRAMAASDLLHTYQLRLALGMMYGYVGRWENPRLRYAASIWMLEHAQDSADDYNYRGNVPPAQWVRLPPNAVKMLATGYASTNRVPRAVETRVRFAELYLKNGQQRFAQQVLDPGWQGSLPDTLDPALRQKVADVTARATASNP